jgi:hypothetical protein
MRLYIPACGDRITLTEPWTFRLWLERRNVKFAAARGLIGKDDAPRWGGIYEGSLNRKGGRDFRKVEVTIPAGTVLECDRVYIRTQNKSGVHAEDDYDSITWKVMRGDKQERHGRFWAKLSDCNGLEYDLAHDSLYRDRIKTVRLVMES